MSSQSRNGKSNGLKKVVKLYGNQNQKVLCEDIELELDEEEKNIVDFINNCESKAAKIAT